MSYNNIMPIIRDVIAVVAPLFAIIIAWLGLQTWRKQLKGNKSYELSLKMLLAVYKVRNAIYNLRQIFIPVHEIINAMKDNDIDGNINDENLKGLQMKAVYISRWSRVQQSLVEYEVTKTEAEALWGSIIIDSVIKPFETLIKKLRAQIYLISVYSKPDYINHLLINDPTNILFSTSDEDAFSIEFKASISNIEDFLRQKMKV